MSEPEERKGPPFERLVAAVQQKLDPGSEVEWNARLRGKRGRMRQVDVAVRGTLGSSKIFVAIEAKDYGKKVGLERVEAFATKLQDIGAQKGIMVCRFGFTKDALIAGADARIDMCVLRPAKDEDWEGYNRTLEMTLSTKVRLYHDAEIVLVDGTRIRVNAGGMQMMQTEDDQTVFFDHVVNTFLAKHPDKDDTLVTIKANPSFFMSRENERDPIEVDFLRCHPRYEDGLSQTFIEQAPEDWVFVKHLPTGEVLDEKSFFELAELERVAQKFKRRSTKENRAPKKSGTAKKSQRVARIDRR